MTTNFSLQSINAEVAKKLSGNVMPAENFRELKTTFSMESVQIDGKKALVDGSNTFYPLGNGAVQQMTEYSANGIPINLFYAIKYGVLSLKWQSVPLQGSVANPMLETKQISRLDPIPARAGQEFNLGFSSGYAQRASPQPTSRWACKTNKVSPANTIDPKLKGQAIEVGCEFTNGDAGSVSGRTTWLVLENYGVPIVIESATATGKSTYKITEVKVEN